MPTNFYKTFPFLMSQIIVILSQAAVAKYLESWEKTTEEIASWCLNSFFKTFPVNISHINTVLSQDPVAKI